MNIKAMREQITEFTFIRVITLDLEGERFFETIHKYIYEEQKYFELFHECIDSIHESFGDLVKIIKVELITKNQFDSFLKINDGEYRKLSENEKIEFLVLY